MSIRFGNPNIPSDSFFVFFATFALKTLLYYYVVCMISRDSFEDSLIPGVGVCLVERESRQPFPYCFS